MTQLTFVLDVLVKELTSLQVYVCYTVFTIMCSALMFYVLVMKMSPFFVRLFSILVCYSSMVNVQYLNVDSFSNIFIASAY